MISTSRHPACLMASAVRKISAFVIRTSFMCENVVGPICPALEQFADETANLPTHRFRLPLVRLPGFSGVGFLFMSFSQAFENRHFTKREISCAIVGRGTREIVPRCAAFFPYLAMIFRRSGPPPDGLAVASSDSAPCRQGLALITIQ